MGAVSPILPDLLRLAAEYSARPARPDSRVYADLGISRGDFLEFVVAIERRYKVDLDWVSPHDAKVQAADPTLQSVADYIECHRP
jgi:hypothetical protein